jgi:4-amino-4-deoxy-L-arabinose transferase-like glycosyltransferase
MSNRQVILLFFITIVVYLLGAFVDVMDVDSGQYASMSREMLASGNWLHFTDRGAPYLDKPPFIFWAGGFSYLILGISNFSFKLPAILFSIAGIYATYRFSKIYFDEQTGKIAALMIATSQAYFHFNNDVRTDVYLTNAVILSMWLLAEYLKYSNWKSLVLAFLFVGIALLAKGPLGLMLPALAFGTTWLLKSQWSNIFRWQWLLGIGISLLVISPMLWGLYTQYDLHPDLVVNEKTNVSGIHFFFWEQSFGRLTGENVWKNDTGPFFFVHNLLWSFLPWSLLLLFALPYAFAKLLQQWRNKQSLHEGLLICLAGSIFTFIALSASAYKLPHYIYVIFPLLAIICAWWVLSAKLSRLQRKLIDGFFWLFLLVAVGFSLLIVFYIFSNDRWWLIFPSIILFVVAVIIFFKQQGLIQKIILPLSLVIIGFNIVMNLNFYPALLEYQAPGRIARFIVHEGINVNKVYNYNVGGRSLDLYTRSIIADFQNIDQSAWGQEYFLHCDEAGLNELKKAGYKAEVLCAFDDKAVTMISWPFLNPSTRKQNCGRRYLISVKK